LVPFFFAAACGNIHSTDHLGDPLVILGARVEGQLPDNISALLLRASLIWETQSRELLECLDRAGSGAEVRACTTPEDFQPALVSNSVPIEPTFPASFEVPLYLLPDLEVLSGQSGSLLGYGVLVVYEDGNRNKMLDLVPPGATASADTILASGMPTRGNRDDFVVYREGDLSPLWKLFESFGCPQPPQGFSILTRELDLDEGYTCFVSPVTNATIPVEFEESEALRQLICEPQPDTNTYPTKPPPPDREVTCHFHDTLEYVVDPSWYCKYKQVYRLVGCHAYFGCEEPDWDLTDSPPDWWPCTGESDNGFTISDHPDDLTPSDDKLFNISYDSGERKFAMDEIEIWLLLTRTEGLVFAHPRSIMFMDNNNDSLFSAGDVLEMFEPVAVDQFNADHQDVRYKVIIQHSVEPLKPVESLAALTWISPAQ
jgi:hypothetical protein